MNNDSTTNTNSLSSNTDLMKEQGMNSTLIDDNIKVDSPNLNNNAIGSKEFYMNISKNLMAGAMARCCAAVIMFPIDVVKTRLQFQSKEGYLQGTLRHHYKNGFNAFLTILKEERLRGLYKGLSVRLIYIAPAAAVSFTVYEQFMRSLQDRFLNSNNKINVVDGVDGQNNNSITKELLSWKVPLLTLSAGVFARILGTACRTPFDILKQQLQIEGQLKDSNRNIGIIGSMKNIFKHDGFKGFFSGYITTLMRDAPFAAIYFTSYEIIKRLFIKRRIQQLHMESNEGKKTKSIHHLIAGALAGAIGTTCTIPIDVVKTRLQTQIRTGKKEYDGIRDAFSKIYKEAGWKGFTRGLGPRLIYIMPASALTFTFYEKLRVLFGVNNNQQKQMAGEEKI
ncbi:hypothetical protein ABK040_005345 [Willaertia magna]